MPSTTTAAEKRQELQKICDEYGLICFIDERSDQQINNLLLAYRHFLAITKHPKSEFTLLSEILSHPDHAQHLPTVFDALTACGGTPSTTPNLFYLCVRHAAIAPSLYVVFNQLHKRRVNPKDNPRPYTEGIECAYYLSRYPGIASGLIANAAATAQPSKHSDQSRLFKKAKLENSEKHHDIATSNTAAP